MLNEIYEMVGAILLFMIINALAWLGQGSKRMHKLFVEKVLDPKVPREDNLLTWREPELGFHLKDFWGAQMETSCR